MITRINFTRATLLAIALLFISSHLRLVADEQAQANDTSLSAYNIAEKLLTKNDVDQAIELLKNSIETNQDPTLLWSSKFLLAQAYQRSNRWEQALNWYLQAFEQNPLNLDPLEKIGNYYCVRGQTDIAYLFANYAFKTHQEQLKKPTNPPIGYNYLIDEQLSITSYYTPFKSEGYEALERLIFNRDVPETVKENAYRNLISYIEPIKALSYQKIEFDRPQISPTIPEYYLALNPSIQRIENGYLVICRTVSYLQEKGNTWISLDPEGNSITRNFLLEYDSSLNLLSQQEIIDDFPRLKQPSKYKTYGLEDCRLFKLNHELWFTCACTEHRYDHVDQMLCKIACNPKLKQTSIANCVGLTYDTEVHQEKNWLPFIKDNVIHVIYKSDPFTVLKIDPRTGKCETSLVYQPQYDLRRFRGSAAPIPFENGYLVVVHETIYTDQRFYTHRFMFLDKDLKITKISKPFYFLQKGIEYCSGMTLNHQEDQCILTFGFKDRAACFCILDIKTIHEMLKSLQ